MSGSDQTSPIEVAPTDTSVTSTQMPQIEDAEARRMITETLDRTLFVEAGAGSGKTQSLVARVISLVMSGMEIDQIAAITFTEKAATELVDRIRTQFERIAVGRTGADHDPVPRPEPHHSDLAQRALEELDGAAIGTLHSFAQRILTEFPVEAGLPPGVEVLDEISSQVEFDQRWRSAFDALLDTESLHEAIGPLWANRVQGDKLRDLARAFTQNWDLVAERVPTDAVEVPPLDRLRLARLLDPVVQLERRLSECTDPSADTLVPEINRATAWARHLLTVTDDPGAVLTACPDPTGTTPNPTFKWGNKGAKSRWDAETLAELRLIGQGFIELHTEIRTMANEALLTPIVSELARFTLTEADRRRAEGRLEFHDLLVHARRLLTGSRDGVAGAGAPDLFRVEPARADDVRRSLAVRYRRLLLDEFQDTDPIQIELAVRIAGALTDPAVATRHWPDVDIDPGHLFFVGDPKQSIYRFRRADIATFLTAQDAFGDPAIQLTSNFRTVGPIVEWVNQVFGSLIIAKPGSQPAYTPLEPHREPAEPAPTVKLLGAEPHRGALNAKGKPAKITAGNLRIREAGTVAAAITEICADEWLVSSAHDPDDDDLADVAASDAPEWRPARLGDICILLPARTSLPALERALDANGIPYRAETSSLVWSTREVRDLVLALGAIADPTDELAIVATLRSPLYGCADDELLAYRRARGSHWDLHAPTPDGLDDQHPVVAGLAHLAELHDQRYFCAPSELINRLASERRLLEQGATEPRPREVWRRIRFVIDQARAWSDTERGSLRDFLGWARLQSAEGARVSETVLPETDDDAVRIMTIHASKGLEFPIVMLSGLTTAIQSRRAGVKVVFPPDSNTYGLSLNSDTLTSEFERFRPIDEQLDYDERLRLLYVAATRAQDHLLISTHRADTDISAKDDNKLTSAELLWKMGNPDEAPSAAFEPRSLSLSTTPGPSAGEASADPKADFAEWKHRRDAAVTNAARTRSLAATSLAAARPSPASPLTDPEGVVGPSQLNLFDQLSESVAASAWTPDPAGDAPAPGLVDPGLAKGAVDLGLPAWNKGRYGTAIGRAVHAVLQTVDLSGCDDATLAASVAAQAAAEGVIGHEPIISALVTSALGSDTVAEASISAHWRELYVATPIGGLVLEGYVDLMYETDAGLVIVDHKTDEIADEDDLLAKLARYRLQGAAYAVATEAATGRDVAEVRFLFLRPGAAREITLDTLAADKLEVLETARLTADA